MQCKLIIPALSLPPNIEHTESQNQPSHYSRILFNNYTKQYNYSNVIIILNKITFVHGINSISCAKGIIIRKGYWRCKKLVLPIKNEGKFVMKKLKFVLMALLVVLFISGCSNDDKKTGGNTSEENTTVADLDTVKAQFKMLGDIPIPADNPMTAEKIELGKKLYFDQRLSGDNKTSCMSCHVPSNGFGDGKAKFVGFEGAAGARNSPTVINSGYYHSNFWDGRAASLEEQAVGPIQSPVEMNQNMDALIVELNAVPEYVTSFNNVFNDSISKENIGKAIAAFERTIVVKDTAFDKYLGGDDSAITDEAKKGMELFVGKAGCSSCHIGPNLSDDSFRNTGITGDDGRFTVTKKEVDKGRFRTPTLRALTQTAPFMHDGSLATIEDVVKYYNKGGGSDPNKDPLMRPLYLTDDEVKNLVAFLESMGGEPIKVAAPKLP